MPYYVFYEEMRYFRYWDTVYWLIITASTIGYGDYFPTTDLAKIFMIFYLSGHFMKNIVYIPRKYTKTNFVG